MIKKKYNRTSKGAGRAISKAQHINPLSWGDDIDVDTLIERRRAVAEFLSKRRDITEVPITYNGISSELKILEEEEMLKEQGSILPVLAQKPKNSFKIMLELFNRGFDIDQATSISSDISLDVRSLISERGKINT
jgi:hypothetical protein